MEKEPVCLKGLGMLVPGTSKHPTQVLKKDVPSTELGPCTVGMHLAQKVNVEDLPIYLVLFCICMVFTRYFNSAFKH